MVRCCDVGKHRNTGQPEMRNAKVAEQNNKPLATLKALAVHMNPLTLLWLTRLKLYRQKKNRVDPWRARRGR